MTQLELDKALEDLEREKDAVWYRKLDGEFDYLQVCGEFEKILVRKRMLLKEVIG